MSSDKSTQIVLVTGGSRGIGRGIVQSFLAQGADVALMDLKPLAPPDAPSDRLVLLQGDVSHPED